MNIKYFCIVIVLSAFQLSNVQAWDNEELEIFDLVEEINLNFYQILGVNQVW